MMLQLVLLSIVAVVAHSSNVRAEDTRTSSSSQYSHHHHHHPHDGDGINQRFIGYTNHARTRKRSMQPPPFELSSLQHQKARKMTEERRRLMKMKMKMRMISPSPSLSPYRHSTTSQPAALGGHLDGGTTIQPSTSLAPTTSQAPSASLAPTICNDNDGNKTGRTRGGKGGHRSGANHGVAESPVASNSKGGSRDSQAKGRRKGGCVGGEKSRGEGSSKGARGNGKPTRSKGYRRGKGGNRRGKGARDYGSYDESHNGVGTNSTENDWNETYYDSPTDDVNSAIVGQTATEQEQDAPNEVPKVISWRKRRAVASPIHHHHQSLAMMTARQRGQGPAPSAVLQGNKHEAAYPDDRHHHPKYHAKEKRTLPATRASSFKT